MKSPGNVVELLQDLIAQAHTKDEFIHVNDLQAGTAFFRNWITVAERETQ